MVELQQLELMQVIQQQVMVVLVQPQVLMALQQQEQVVVAVDGSRVDHLLHLVQEVLAEEEMVEDQEEDLMDLQTPEVVVELMVKMVNQ